MSLWWAKKNQLDEHQISLIEELPLRENHLVLGPPGSGKTNVLLRRAQFVRSQGMPNVMVLTFTRTLTEFIKTGCMNPEGKEIFPLSCVSTLESWIRGLYGEHGLDLPNEQDNLTEWKIALATGALDIDLDERLPLCDALFVDEAQDLLPVEVALLAKRSEVLFFVADSRQKIYDHAGGLEAVREHVKRKNESELKFHYRLAPEICQMADRILRPVSGEALSATSQYDGPKPGHIEAIGPASEAEQIEQLIARLREQIRAYGDLISEGDRLGVIVARTDDRVLIHEHLEEDEVLHGKSQIVRARTGRDDDPKYSPTLDPDVPICIVTVQGCKGLEFRAVHWPFCEKDSWRHTAEHYYTVVTRAKTSLDLYYTKQLPQALTRAYSNRDDDLW